LKNIEEPVHVWTWEPGDPTPAVGNQKHIGTCRRNIEPRSWACCPFANLSDSADEYFSDGLTEDLIHALSLQSFYRVLSRKSTFSFKAKVSARA